MAQGFCVGGRPVDGLWTLTVVFTDLHVEKNIRVNGDMHVGGLLYSLTNNLDGYDWSDHALYWPEKNQWLLRTKSTLDQYNVGADTCLHFTPMHKLLRIRLPDLRRVDCRVNFSIKCFNVVAELCRDLGIRHYEELSLTYPLENWHLKANYQSVASTTKNHVSGDIGGSNRGSIDSLDHTSHRGADHQSSKHRSNGTMLSNNSLLNAPHSPSGSRCDAVQKISPVISGNEDLSSSAPLPPLETQGLLLRPRSLTERARLNVGWLDSSLSIMEQGVREGDILCLRFKYYAFYDLDPSCDAVRINMLYEQAKWQILGGELECTGHEALLFSALQLQSQLQSQIPQQPGVSPGIDGLDAVPDDIDSALDNLENMLETTSVQDGNQTLSSVTAATDITSVPKLTGYLQYLRSRKFTLKGTRRYWFVCKELSLFAYKSHEIASADHAAVFCFGLEGCEVTPDVNVAIGKFAFKLQVISCKETVELNLRCDSEEQYARWVAAFRLASRGCTMADHSYNSMVQSIRELLALQRPSVKPVFSVDNISVDPSDLLPTRYINKYKAKHILDSHANVAAYSLIDARLSYIRAWQNLPSYGISYFIVRFSNSKRDELLGIAPDRLIRANLTSNDHIKTWRLKMIKAWNVNWEARHMMLQFANENVVFECLSANCKIIHEFIGGNIFLQMRPENACHTLDEDLFHKLTGGWD